MNVAMPLCRSNRQDFPLTNRVKSISTGIFDPKYGCNLSGGHRDICVSLYIYIIYIYIYLLFSLYIYIV